MFGFLNHTLKLEAPDQPQVQGKKSLWTRDIMSLLVKRFV